MDFVSTLASVGTFIVACLVFWEARSIRKAEWIFRQNQAWSDHCHAIAELHEGNEIGELLLGKEVDKTLTPREAFLLMSFFNVVSSEYNALRAGVIVSHYVVDSFTQTAHVARTNRKWIVHFLTESGYERSFIRIIAILITVGEDIAKQRDAVRRELRALSWLGTLRGASYRAKVRSALDEDAIADLLASGNSVRPLYPDSPVI